MPAVGVHVVLTEVATGLTREAGTDRTGAYAFDFLAPGFYELLAERLGDQPVRVVGIVVSPGRAAAVSTILRSLPGGATPDDVEIEAHNAGTGLAGLGNRGFGQFELSNLPDHSLGLTDLARFSSQSGVDGAVEGLPASASAHYVDGVAVQTGSLPGLAGNRYSNTALAKGWFSRADLLTNGTDVEYGGVPGATYSGFSRQGTQSFVVRAFADWNGSASRRSDHFAPEDLSQNSVRGGVLLGGPLVRDTAHYAIGFQFERLEIALPRPFESAALDGPIASIAQDSFGVDLTRHFATRTSSSDQYSVFGRLGWQLSERSRVDVRANVGSMSTAGPDLGEGRLALTDGQLDGKEMSTAASLTTSISQRVGLELRFGMALSDQEFTSGDVAATQFASDPVAFGTDPILPGRAKLLSVNVGEVIHVRVRRHHLKFGTTVTFASSGYTIGAGSLGSYFFSDTTAFGATQGAFIRTVGNGVESTFSTLDATGFFQDSWTAAPGVNITLGVRVGAQIYPSDKVAQNEEWLQLSGVSTADFSRSTWTIAPRALVQWRPGVTEGWSVSADAGVYHGMSDAVSFADLVTRNGTVQIERVVGALGGWPAPTPAGGTTSTEPALALFGPQFQSPRTFRTSVTLALPVAPRTTLQLSGAYRHTDFLPRWQDLNLAPNPTFQDQYGRPVYGTLEQFGGVIAPTPGSNRRFGEFDVVDAITADGYSDYWGVTALLERRMTESLNMFASYTLSKAEDNWLGAVGGHRALQKNPFPRSVASADWADGRSDLDVPHRVVVGAEVQLGGVATLAAAFRFESGRPFTPGVGNAVDINGDGAFGNDPAYIDNAIPGMDALLTDWTCLNDNVGAFAPRNACRAPSTKTLDVRLTLQPLRIGGYPVSIFLDAINLLDADAGDIDRALYRVDASSALATDAASRTVTVPWIVNDNFGQMQARRAMGRLFRVGMRIAP